MVRSIRAVTGFLAACNPDYAVISCGRDNIYGHPHKETLKRLDMISAEIFRTDRSGAVICEDGKMTGYCD